MFKLSGKHVGIACLLFVYFAAIFYMAPIFAPTILEPTLANTATYFAVTYGFATFCTFFCRLFYVTDVSFKFELLAGLAVAFVFFVLIGQPRLRANRLPDLPVADLAFIAAPPAPWPAPPGHC
jgi:hypothetical protein